MFYVQYFCWCSNLWFSVTTNPPTNTCTKDDVHVLMILMTMFLGMCYIEL